MGWQYECFQNFGYQEDLAATILEAQQELDTHMKKIDKEFAEKMIQTKAGEARHTREVYW